jgi:hypothetical protein
LVPLLPSSHMFDYLFDHTVTNLTTPALLLSVCDVIYERSLADHIIQALSHGHCKYGRIFHRPSIFKLNKTGWDQFQDCCKLVN